jgi:hypothetical protein
VLVFQLEFEFVSDVGQNEYVNRIVLNVLFVFEMKKKEKVNAID